jgi:hypothetical protein
VSGGWVRDGLVPWLLLPGLLLVAVLGLPLLWLALRGRRALRRAA